MCTDLEEETCRTMRKKIVTIGDDETEEIYDVHTMISRFGALRGRDG